MFGKSFARDRQVYLTHLADALARTGKRRDLEAADRGLEAVHLTECLTSTQGLDCLRDLYARMRPHTPVPAVRNFLERLGEFWRHSGGGRIRSRHVEGAASGVHHSSRSYQRD